METQLVFALAGPEIHAQYHFRRKGPVPFLSRRFTVTFDRGSRFNEDAHADICTQKKNR